METAGIVSILSQLFILHSCSKYVVRNEEVLKLKKTRKEKKNKECGAWRRSAQASEVGVTAPRAWGLQDLWLRGSVTTRHVGFKPVSPGGQAGSYPLRHQGSPAPILLMTARGASI